MTTGPVYIDPPYTETWIFKLFTMMHTALIGTAQQWYPRLPLEKRPGKSFAENFRRNLIIINRKHRQNYFWKA